MLKLFLRNEPPSPSPARHRHHSHCAEARACAGLIRAPTLGSAAHIPLFLYPFLNTVSKTRPFEYLRLTSLGVIGALVKVDDADVINFLLSTEIIPLCLRIMETGSELSKTVATFIVQKILLDNNGLAYVCTTSDRFFAVSKVLSDMVNNLITNPSVRLLKHCVRCYLRLTDNPRAREALRTALPQSLRDETFLHLLRDDITVRKWLAQLLQAVKSVHDSGVVHRDVKGANVLTTKDGVVKIADFGVALRRARDEDDDEDDDDETANENGMNATSSDIDVQGTPYWMAPEAIEMRQDEKKVGFASDVWSVGCVVVELLTGAPPYFDMQPMPAMFAIVRDKRPPLPSGISDAMRDFLKRCFRKDPKARPGDNSRRIELHTHEYTQVVLYDHVTRRKT